jgi:hypothetical protein
MRLLRLLAFAFVCTLSLPAAGQTAVDSRYDFSSGLTDQNDANELEVVGPAFIGESDGDQVAWLVDQSYLGVPADLHSQMRFDESFSLSFEFMIPSDSLSAERGVRMLAATKAWSYSHPGFRINMWREEGSTNLSFQYGLEIGGEMARYFWGIAHDKWHYVSMSFDFQTREVTFAFNSQILTVSLDEGIDGTPVDSTPFTDTLPLYAPRFGDAHPQTDGIELYPEEWLDPLDNPEMQSTYLTVAMDNIHIATPKVAGNSNVLVEALNGITEHITQSNLTASEVSDLQRAVRDNLQGADPELVIPAFKAMSEAYAANRESVYDPYGPTIRHEDVDDVTRIFLDTGIWLLDQGLTPASAPLAEGIVFEDHANWPGSVPASAERVEEFEIEANASYPRPEGYLLTQMDYNPSNPLNSALYRPLGVYAPAGELITITADPSLVNSGVYVRVGVHTFDVREHSDSNRYPLISVDYPIDAETIQVVNPMGGGIYLVVPMHTDLGWVPLQVSGAVRAPFYSSRTGREMTEAEWAEQRTFQAPWADFESDKYQFAAPTDQIVDFERADTLMARWDRAMDIMQVVYGRPTDRTRPEGWALDTKSPAIGSYPGGYPVYPGLWAVRQGDLTKGAYSPFALTDERVFEESWGGEFVIMIHEMAHHHAPYTPQGEIESIVNLPAAAVLNYVMDVELDESLKLSSFQRLDRLGAAIDWMAMDNFRSGKEIAEHELRYQDRGIAKYIDLVDMFGSWDAMYDVYRPFYEADLATGGPFHMGQRVIERNDFMIKASEGLGCNVASLFEFWGFIPSMRAELTLSSYPVCEGAQERIEYYLENAPRSAEEAWDFFRLAEEGIANNGIERWVWEPLTQRFGTAEGQQIRTRGAEILKKYFDVDADDAPSAPQITSAAFNIAGSSSGEVSFSWSPSVDPENADLTYSWRLYDVESGQTLVYRTRVSGSEVSVPVSELSEALQPYAGASRQRVLAQQVTTSDLFTVVPSNPAFLLYQDGVATTGSPAIMPGPDSYAVDEDVELAVSIDNGVLNNDQYTGSETLTAQLVSEPANGSISFNNDGSFTYRPGENFNGEDAFYYTVTDGDHSFSSVRVVIDVDPVPDPPTVPFFDAYESFVDLSGDRGQLFEPSWRAVSDPDGDVLEFTYVMQVVDNSQFVVQEDVGIETEFSISYGTLNDRLFSMGFEPGDVIYMREYLTVTDGIHTVQGWESYGEFKLGHLAVNTEGSAELPKELELAPNYPNPFNPVTTLRFGLPSPGVVHLAVYDVLGRRVAVPFSGPAEAGWHDVRFDASSLGSGIYFQVLDAGGKRQTRLITLLK